MIDLKIAATFIIAAIEVVRLWDAYLGRRLAKSGQNFPIDTRFLNSPFAICTVHVIAAGKMVFSYAEIGQNVVPGPAHVAHLPPLIIVPGLSAHVDHAVDGRTAAQNLAPGVVDGPAIQAWFRLGLVAPIRSWIAQGVKVTNGNMDPVIIILAASFQQ